MEQISTVSLRAMAKINLGLDVLRRIAAEAMAFLEPDGKLISEIGEEQGERVAAIFRENGFGDVTIGKDYCGKDRFLTARNTIKKE